MTGRVGRHIDHPVALGPDTAHPGCKIAVSNLGIDADLNHQLPNVLGHFGVLVTKRYVINHQFETLAVSAFFESSLI